MDFFLTGTGRKFFEADLPRLIRAIEGLSENIKESNSLKKEEVAILEKANQQKD